MRFQYGSLSLTGRWTSVSAPYTAMKMVMRSTATTITMPSFSMSCTRTARQSPTPWWSPSTMTGIRISCCWLIRLRILSCWTLRAILCFTPMNPCAVPAALTMSRFTKILKIHPLATSSAKTAMKSACIMNLRVHGTFTCGSPPSGIWFRSFITSDRSRPASSLA